MAETTADTRQTPSELPRSDSLDVPPSPRRAARHAKELSLNFPILLPTQHASQSTSPRTVSTTITSGRSSPRTKAASLLHSPDIPSSPTPNNADFLTLVAAQERKVLELREELQRAELELSSLKNQWTRHEANKKKDESRHIRRMPPPLDNLSHGPKPLDEFVKEEEQKRRKALVELNNNAAGQAPRNHGLGRRDSQRKVFEGRHTRALSLLSPTTPRKPQDVADMVTDRAHERTVVASEFSRTPSDLDRPSSLSRMPTLDGFISPDPLQTGTPHFGKTYRDLAAQHGKSLPPAAADMIKQGRYMVEGVRDGLWTFFEDIRQATVGDEAVYGPSVQQQQRLKGHARRKNRKATVNPNGTGSTTSKKIDSVGEREESFWKEFGLDTPGKSVERAKTQVPQRSTNSNKRDRHEHAHVQRQSDDSTEFQNPPDLLADSPDAYSVGKDDEELDWENWETLSPLATRRGPAQKVTPEDILEVAT